MDIWYITENFDKTLENYGDSLWVYPSIAV